MSSVGIENGEEGGESSLKPPVRRPSGGKPAGMRPFTHLSRSLLDGLSMSALETEEAVASDDEEEVESRDFSVDAATNLGRRMSDAVISTPSDAEPGQPPSSTEVETTQFSSPGDLAAQLYANPKLAALRGSMGMGITPLQTNVKPSVVSPPILANPKCSGYFVEPVRVPRTRSCNLIEE